MCVSYLSIIYDRADSGFVPSEWVTVLVCNIISHWLDTSPESVLYDDGLITSRAICPFSILSDISLQGFGNVANPRESVIVKWSYCCKFSMHLITIVVRLLTPNLTLHLESNSRSTTCDALQKIRNICLHQANCSAYLLFKAQQMEYYLQFYLKLSSNYSSLSALWPAAFWLRELVSLRPMVHKPSAWGTWYKIRSVSTMSLTFEGQFCINP